MKATFDDITTEFQSSIDEKIDNSEQYFQDQEKDDLIAKLDELKKRVASFEAEMGIDPNQVKAIESAIEKNKADADVYPKGVWYKISGNMLTTLFKEALKSKGEREVVTDIIRKWIS